MTHVQVQQHHLYGATEEKQKMAEKSISVAKSEHVTARIQCKTAVTPQRSVYCCENNGHDEGCNIDMALFAFHLLLIYSLSMDKITDHNTCISCNSFNIAN
jgi:hypothetical protein